MASDLMLKIWLAGKFDKSLGGDFKLSRILIPADFEVLFTRTESKD